MLSTGPRNFCYNLRSVDEVEGVENAINEAPLIAPDQDSEDTMASGLSMFLLEKFRGDGTDNITDFLKKFDRYVNLCNVKPEQQYDLVCLQLEGRAWWYIDSLNQPPADLAALKVSNGAKIRNRYNQVPHLTQDTNGKVTNSQKTPQTRAKRSALSQQVTTKHI